MPELPEVETVRRTLIELVKGKTIEDVEVRWPKMIKHPDDVQQFSEYLKGQTIHDVKRRGKFLIFVLDNDVLISHLRMEGRYGLYRKEDEVDKHTHVLFTFTDNSQLRYKDVRKFGTMHIFKKGTEEDVEPLNKLGPEPFSEHFTVEHLAHNLSRTTRKVKTALLDQVIVTGLGNIYVDEALFRSGVHPERLGNSLIQQEVSKLHEQIVSTLKEAVDKGGSTIRSYVNTQGEMGMFQLELFVYGKQGEPCSTCGKEIEKTVVGGRGTHFCSNCQK
ncbi:DNA-formamidopyrimidine glycosylase [Bacillus solimangrovi]|uniref:Formamidopyrimidine-DNA glycosylase n=1 Tax=Bacillus solimangrovi TaxID=1305675 RepID=A0A1E5LCR1_9BACI|nr:DNA-formamidopyrimidine glycosylase [Bacillus solimangrovi]OEH91866.1 DNA-formamidopyrimidine glycosylase [Bacillus solimangrovi]